MQTKRLQISIEWQWRQRQMLTNGFLAFFDDFLPFDLELPRWFMKVIRGPQFNYSGGGRSFLPGQMIYFTSCLQYLFHTLPQAKYLFHFLVIYFFVYKVESQTRLGIDVGEARLYKLKCQLMRDMKYLFFRQLFISWKLNIKIFKSSHVVYDLSGCHGNQ